MRRAHHHLGNIWHVASSSASIPAWAAAIVILLGSIVATQMNNALHEERTRAELLHRANLVASRLHGLIDSNVELVRGMAAVIATEPDIDQRRFASLGESLFHTDNQLNNLAGAPDLVVSLVYPMKGNEKVIGLDYHKNEAQRKVALQVRDSGNLILAGPVNLVQGGQGFIARFPVFYDNAFGKRVFWGILSSVISVEKLYAAAGLDKDPTMIIGLRGRDASGAAGSFFYGDQDIANQSPVRVEVPVPNGSWELAAVPADGWPSGASTNWMIWLAALASLLLVVVPYAAVGWLSRERVDHLKDLLRGQNRLARMTKRLELAVQISQIGVWEYDIARKKAIWDEQMYEFYGIEPGLDPDKANWKQYLHPEDHDRVLGSIQQLLDTGEPIKGTFRICHPSGQIKTIRTIASRQTDKLGNRHITGVNWDISEDVERTRLLTEAQAESERRYEQLEVAKAEIEVNSLHDFLTGLPNRRYLDEKLTGRHGISGSLESRISLLKIDLDGFKEINDKMGHAAGDSVLVHVANLLRNLVGEGEFIARVGGDEFVMITCTDDDPRRPRLLADKIIKAAQKPIDVDGRICRIGASVGIAHGASAQGDVDKLLSNADLALYEAKQTGKGRYVIFSQPLYRASRRQREVADDILRGVEAGEFVPYFQGQYKADGHELCGAEALARWNHPKKGILAPNTFIDVADSLGVVGAIDEAILDQALAAKERWQAAGLVLPRISVNVSARRLSDKDLLCNLRKKEFDAESLTFELVETTFLDIRDELVAWNIDQIRDMGIDIELDDFGTAYASIVSLTNLRPNRLKIDRQLVGPTTQSDEQCELVRSIVQIGHAMNIGTVAEGIETIDHASIMQELGADILQGFAFCKPMSEEDFLTHHLGLQQSVVA